MVQFTMVILKMVFLMGMEDKYLYLWKKDKIAKDMRVKLKQGDAMVKENLFMTMVKSIKENERMIINVGKQ